MSADMADNREQATTPRTSSGWTLMACLLIANVGALLFARWLVGSWEGVLWLAVGVLVPSYVIFRLMGDGFET